jgi:hypothetical protein
MSVVLPVRLASTTATQEFVVPRSIPMILAMARLSAYSEPLSNALP